MLPTSNALAEPAPVTSPVSEAPEKSAESETPEKAAASEAPVKSAPSETPEKAAAREEEARYPLWEQLNELNPDKKPFTHEGLELALSNALVFLVNEDALAYSLHVHGVYTFTGSQWGLGLGYERVFDDHGHDTFGVVGCYRISHPLAFCLSPGLTFADHDDDHDDDHDEHEEEGSHGEFSLHAELGYEFHIGSLHVGPALEFAYAPEDIHIGLGLHIGFMPWAP
jgi:hypothetical protein